MGRTSRRPSPMTPVVALFALAMVVVAVVVAVAIGATVVQRLGRDDEGSEPERGSEPAPARTAEEAFAPLAREGARLPGQAREWLAGARPDATFGADVERALAAFEASRDRVRELPASELYEAATLLYIEHARLYLAALGMEGDLRVQTDLTARRVRLLADRTFDRAHVAAGGQLGVSGDPNVVVNLPEEVPDWDAEGLAPGPPLDDAPAATARPALREAERPTQPRAQWIEAVEASGAPPAEQLATAIDAGDQAALGELAAAFVEAAERLRQTPDPAGDREGATTIRLSLLVASEAARAGQLGEQQIARRLALVGDRMWRAEGLAPRRSGFDAALLR